MTFRYAIFVIILFIAGIGISISLRQVDRLRPGPKTQSDNSTPQRIICAAPNIVEVIYALGEQDRIAGVGDYTHYPPDAMKKKRIGGTIDPNKERILTLQPDVIISQGKMENLAILCEENGIAFLRLDMENLASIFDGIKTIGEVLGCPEKANTLISGIRERLENIRKQSESIGHRPKVFLCMGRRAGSLSGLYTMSGKTFFDELLNLAGGDNIFSDAGSRYPQISKESLLTRAPEVILEFCMEENSQLKQEDVLRDWQAMPSLPAVASGRVYLVTDEYVMISGPRVDWTAQRFFDLIHASDDKKH